MTFPRRNRIDPAEKLSVVVKEVQSLYQVLAAFLWPGLYLARLFLKRLCASPPVILMASHMADVLGRSCFRRAVYVGGTGAETAGPQGPDLLLAGASIL